MKQLGEDAKLDCIFTFLENVWKIKKMKRFQDQSAWFQTNKLLWFNQELGEPLYFIFQMFPKFVFKFKTLKYTYQLSFISAPCKGCPLKYFVGWKWRNTWNLSFEVFAD